MELHQQEIKNEFPCYMKKLPMVLLLSIQDYLDMKNYWNFLNSCRLILHEVKYETQQYCLTFDEAPISIDIGELNKLQILIEKVKNPRKQIKLMILYVSKYSLPKYIPFFHNIHEVVISLQGMSSLNDEDVDFSIFNNIPKVTLIKFHGISRITKGFENVKELKIIRFTDLISIDCPLENFDLLSFDGCSRLNSLPFIKRTKRIEIIDMEMDAIDLSGTTDSLKSFHFKDNQSETLFWMPQGINCETIESFSAMNFYFDEDNYLEEDYIDFSIFSRIPTVCLHNTSNRIALIFPIFHGKLLELEFFDLSLWNDSSLRMENLQILHLGSCANCFELPIFPQVKEVTLLDMNHLFRLSSSSLPNCRSLTIHFSSSITQIHRLPKLKYLKMQYCGFFYQFNGFIKDTGGKNDADDDGDELILKEVIIDRCGRFHDLVSLRNVYDLQLIEPNGIRSFKGFDSSLLSKQLRKVSITEFDAKNCDLEGLGNIGTLSLNNVKNLDTASIGEVDQLLIDGE